MVQVNIQHATQVSEAYALELLYKTTSAIHSSWYGFIFVAFGKALFQVLNQVFELKKRQHQTNQFTAMF